MRFSILLLDRGGETKNRYNIVKSPRRFSILLLDRGGETRREAARYAQAYGVSVSSCWIVGVKPLPPSLFPMPA